MKKRIGLVACLAVGCAVAQPVYRCGNTYSHEPCPGAKLVDTTYTEGVDSLSGQKRISGDVLIQRTAREVHNELYGKPNRGKGVQERFDAQWRRSTGNLTVKQRLHCEALDKAMPLEKDPNRLYELRLQYRRSGC